MDAHSHILNNPEWTSLLGNQFYFEESDLGLKKLNIFLMKFYRVRKSQLVASLLFFNELEGEQKECSKCEETSVIDRQN